MERLRYVIIADCYKRICNISVISKRINLNSGVVYVQSIRLIQSVHYVCPHFKIYVNFNYVLKKITRMFPLNVLQLQAIFILLMTRYLFSDTIAFVNTFTISFLEYGYLVHHDIPVFYPVRR